MPVELSSFVLNDDDHSVPFSASFHFQKNVTRVVTKDFHCKEITTRTAEPKVLFLIQD